MEEMQVNGLERQKASGQTEPWKAEKQKGNWTGKKNLQLSS